jgi:hypothetical protein
VSTLVEEFGGESFFHFGLSGWGGLVMNVWRAHALSGFELLRPIRVRHSSIFRDSIKFVDGVFLPVRRLITGEVTCLLQHDE